MAKAKRIGEVLREVRIEAGLSARDIERLSGMSTGIISQIESGRRQNPGFSTILKLARAIGVSMEDLAVRSEGRTTKGSPSGARESERALVTIAKAQVDHQKLGARLAEVAEALAATNRNK